MELLERMRREPRPFHILVFSIHFEEERVLRALELGARGYLVKSAARHELLEALRVVAGDGFYLHPQVAQAVTRGLNARSSQQALLSEREIEVLECVRDGLSNGQIAERLFLSPNTIKAHLKNIFHRLNARDRTQAVVVALEKGLLTR